MKILFLLLLVLGCYANPTGSELKKTPSTAFDFTMVPSNDIKETLQDMIMVEIGKELFLERRKNNLWQCQVDPFGTDYCPTGLAPAKPYTAYYQSTSYERESTVKDYQNGSSVKRTGSVVDYTKKITEEVCSSAEMYSYCADSAMFYSDASSYCSNLVEGGYSDWRLPTIHEAGVPSGMGAGVGVPSCLTGGTWTSTDYGYDKYAWWGSSVSYIRINNKGWVVCVR